MDDDWAWDQELAGDPWSDPTRREAPTLRDNPIIGSSRTQPRPARPRRSGAFAQRAASVVATSLAVTLAVALVVFVGRGGQSSTRQPTPEPREASGPSVAVPTTTPSTAPPTTSTSTTSTTAPRSSSSPSTRTPSTTAPPSSGGPLDILPLG
jgi:hypothetical protein